MTTTEHGILVGVTGRGENTAALVWAAAEARRRSCAITLVHAVTPVLPPPPPSVLLTSGPLLDVGKLVLEEVSEELVALAGPDVPVRSLVEHQHAGWLLTELSADAELVVVAHRRRRGLGRIATRSTEVSAAAHAHCPVVAVPSDWSGDPTAAGQAWVTVGVHEAGGPEEALEAGFALADERGAPLRLVHAWRSDPVYEDIIMRRVDPGWADRARDEVQRFARPVADRYPGVEVDVLVEHQWPADALVDLAPTSAVLVVGRHGTPLPLPPRLGSVARTVLTKAPCPVVVVPVP